MTGLRFTLFSTNGPLPRLRFNPNPITLNLLNMALEKVTDQSTPPYLLGRGLVYGGFSFVLVASITGIVSLAFNYAILVTAASTVFNKAIETLEQRACENYAAEREATIQLTS